MNVTPPIRQLLREQVDEVLYDSLLPRERRVLQLRFGLEDGRARTLVATGREIERSKSTVWRIERKALGKLRHPGPSKKLKDYLL